MNRSTEHNREPYATEHEQITLALPWYVNGTLDEAERARVRDHLSTCLVCRRELVALSALAGAVVGRTREPRAEAALSRLHERLDESAARGRYFPWAAAAVLVIVTGLAGLVGLNTGLIGNHPMSKAYLTLGARTIVAEDNPLVTARIVFARDVTEPQLRKLLLDAHAELIDGPTPRGAYTIALPQAIPGDDLQHAVASLRASKRVLFVEPIVSNPRQARTE